MFEAWHLRQQQVQADEEQIRRQLRSLTAEQRLAFYKVYTPHLKDPDTYASLNWLFIAGAHHFYLGKWLLGCLDFGIMALGIFMLFVLPTVGLSLIVLVTVIEVPALFRSQTIVAHYNNRLALRTLASILSF